MENSLYELPFDQFQRYKAVEEVLGIIRGNKPLKILDVGGYPGLISDFLPKDQTYIIDLVPCSKPNYILGNGTSLPFENDSFDVVTAIDTLEHVLPAKRNEFISELVRVSSKLVIIMGPFFSENIHLAERIILEFSLKTLGDDFAESHPLREHLLYGLPQINHLKEELNNLGCEFLIFPSGYLYHWMILNFVKHFLFTIPDSDELHKMVDKYYNTYFYEEDKRDPSYRHMFIATKNQEIRSLNRIRDKFPSHVSAPIKDLSYKLQLFGLLFSLFDLGAKRELEEVRRRNVQLEEVINSKDSQIENFEIALKEMEEEKKLVMEQKAQIQQLKQLIAVREANLQNLQMIISKMQHSPAYAVYKLFNRARNVSQKDGTDQR